MVKKSLVLFFIIGLVACNVYKDLPAPPETYEWKSKVIPASPQIGGGEAAKGLDYIINGDYIGSGIPYEILEKRLNKSEDTVLKREGLNANVPYILTGFEAQNGVAVLNGNCFTCHAGKLNGEVVLGLGNSFSDFEKNPKPLSKAMRLGMKVKYGKKSPEWAAYQDFDRYFTASAPHIETNNPGVNPAAHLAEACVAYRDPQTLEYTGDPILELPDYVIGSDVPPLWNVKKKNALYYTAVGRGDFSKLLFQASVLGIADSAAAREAVNNFKHVVAWLEQLEPPQYPGDIEQNLAQKGQLLFEEHCSGCHGTYGAEETYPNKVIALNVIQTDPYYATYAVQAPIVDWYNQSWFATSYPPSHFEPEAGYIAPPLDGVWATAPYLHNGSVPTLELLLNSKKRPTYWQRSGDSRDYNYEQVGWNFKTKNNASGKWTYDTTIPGYSNSGHYFGDKLKNDERKAVIEYLKTL
jgi:mono/diheme cytochrome c family protein